MKQEFQEKLYKSINTDTLKKGWLDIVDLQKIHNNFKMDLQTFQKAEIQPNKENMPLFFRQPWRKLTYLFQYLHLVTKKFPHNRITDQTTINICWVIFIPTVPKHSITSLHSASDGILSIYSHSLLRWVCHLWTYTYLYSPPNHRNMLHNSIKRKKGKELNDRAVL